MKIEITTLNYCHRAHFKLNGRIKPVSEYGCYYCGEVYELAQHPIVEWVDGEQTALCPICNIDAVIPKIHGVDFTAKDMQELSAKMFA
jgi:hypothetical protein